MEKLGGTLQENLITLLCHSDEHGKVVANFVDPSAFEGDYRVIAERAVDYWKRQGKSPGVHADDLVADIIEDKGDRRGNNFRNILISMLQLSESINAEYVVKQLRTFVRMQQFKEAVIRSSERLASKQELAIDEVEEMWADLIRARDITLDPGMALTDLERVLTYIQYQSLEFKTGIIELDEAGVTPSRGTIMLLLAVTGLGKSWGLVHLGRQAIMQRKRVLHVSLEMSEEEVALRYYQSFFAITKREKTGIKVSRLQKDKNGRLKDITSDELEPEFALTSDAIRTELEAHGGWMQGRFKNMLIKRFPTRSLSVNKLEAFIDNLETANGFIPDMILLDYIGIMHTNVDNHRVSLGRVMEDLRGFAVERNVAMVTAQQISREGAKARRASKTHISEDWSLVGTADQAITLSATETESRLGLARLFVEKARGERDKFGVLITQNYDTGQFVLESAPLDEPRYMDLIGMNDSENGKNEDE